MPIDKTKIKGKRELEIGFVETILIHDKIDEIKKIILRRLHILWNIEQGRNVILNIYYYINIFIYRE